jgi:hypothetical protein
MDQSSELVNNKEIQALLAYHRYTPRPTDSDVSWQNAPGECPYLTIGYQLTIMLHGANLSSKLWHWAFNHCLLLRNMVRHGDRGVPMIRIGGKRPDIAQIRMFGCQVFVCPPGKQPHIWDLLPPSLKPTTKTVVPTNSRRRLMSDMTRARMTLQLPIRILVSCTPI